MSSLLPTSWRSSEDSLSPIEQNRVCPVDPEFIHRLNEATCSLFEKRAEVNLPLHNNFCVMPGALLNTFSILLADTSPNSASARAEISQLLGIDQELFTEAQWHQNFSSWISQHQERSPEESQIRVASAIATKRNEGGLHPQAKEKLAALQLETLPLDVDSINSWVSQKTEGEIKKLMDNIDSQQICSFVTAAYIKGMWKLPFQQANTRPSTFTNSDGSTTEVQQMHMDHASFRTAHIDGKVGILELPMEGNLSMLFIGDSTSESEPGSPLIDFLCSKKVDGLSSWLKRGTPNLTSYPSISISVPKCTIKDNPDLLKELAHTPLSQAIQKARWENLYTGSHPALAFDEMPTKGVLKIDEKGATAAQASTLRYRCYPEHFEFKKTFAVALIDANRALLGLGLINNLSGNSKESSEL